MKAHAVPPPRQRGSILYMFAFAATLLVAMFAATVDLSQLYARKTEIQNAADAAALAGAKSLKASSGSAAAISAAVGAATGTSNNYQYANHDKYFSFAPGAISFAASATSNNWLSPAAAKLAPAGLKFVRVLARDGDSAPLTLATAFASSIGQGATLTVDAVAVAGPINNGVGLRQ
ncbi:MAG: pilus assembly protein TadG-related protein [Pseudomonadota bacterium]